MVPITVEGIAAGAVPPVLPLPLKLTVAAVPEAGFMVRENSSEAVEVSKATLIIKELVVPATVLVLPERVIMLVPLLVTV